MRPGTGCYSCFHGSRSGSRTVQGWLRPQVIPGRDEKTPTEVRARGFALRAYSVPSSTNARTRRTRTPCGIEQVAGHDFGMNPRALASQTSRLIRITSKSGGAILRSKPEAM